MTKEEFIQEAALRLISAWTSTPTSFKAEDVATAAKNTANEVWKVLEEEQPKKPEEPEVIKGIPDGEEIQVLAKEIARIEKEDVDAKNKKSKCSWNRYQISGADVRFLNVCKGWWRDESAIDTVKDLLACGRHDFSRRHGIGKLTLNLVDRALENLYGIKTW